MSGQFPDPRSEFVIPMAPMSVAAIEEVANAFLKEFCPEALLTPTPLPLARWLDVDLQKRGIHVIPVKTEELPDAHAETDPTTEQIEIRMRAEEYDAIFTHGPKTNFARATVCHELGHAILHVRQIRRRQRLSHGLDKLTLKRVDRASLKPFVDPEWQAWTFAGAILAPRSVVTKLPWKDAYSVAAIFKISPQLAANHLRRLKIDAR